MGNELVKTVARQTKGEIRKKHADGDRADEGEIRMRMRHINRTALATDQPELLRGTNKLRTGTSGMDDIVAIKVALDDGSVLL